MKSSVSLRFASCVAPLVLRTSRSSASRSLRILTGGEGPHPPGHLETAEGFVDSSLELRHGAVRFFGFAHRVGAKLPGAELSAGPVFDPERRQVDEGVTRPFQRRVPERFRLADDRRDHRDDLAFSPFRAEQRVVVARLDRDFDGSERALEETIGRKQAMAAPIVPGFAVEAREDPAFFATAAAQDEVHFAKPVVVVRFVARFDLGHVEQLHRLGCAFERHHRRFVGNGRDIDRHGLGNEHVAEAGGDAKLGAPRDGPPGDDLAGGIVDERHLAFPVHEHEASARVKWNAADRHQRPVGELDARGLVRADVALAQVFGRTTNQARLVDPPKRDRRDPAASDENVEPLDDAEGSDEHRDEAEQTGRERASFEQHADAGGTGAHVFLPHARKRSAQMQPRELAGARRLVAHRAIHEPHGAERSMAEVGVGRHHRADHDLFRRSPSAAAHDRPNQEARPYGDERGRRRQAGHGRTQAGQVGKREQGRDATCDRRAASWTVDAVAPYPYQPPERAQFPALLRRGAGGDHFFGREAHVDGIAHRSALVPNPLAHPQAAPQSRCYARSVMAKLKSGGQPFIDALRTGALVGDGGMGTQLYERGMLFSVNYEELNLSRPQVVRKVHEDFLAAGADVIETNTFGANSIRLARHGIENRVREINLAAVKIATEAAAGRAYLAGAIGPTGLLFEGVEGEATRVRAAFKEQAEALAEGGVDLLVIETMRHPQEILLALEAAREAVGRDLPIVTQMSIDQELALADGTQILAMGESLKARGADVVGVNCSDGPQDVFSGDREARVPRHSDHRDAERRAAATRRRTPHLHLDARVLRRLRAPHVQARRDAWSAAAAGRRPSTSGESPPPRAWRASALDPPEIRRRARRRGVVCPPPPPAADIRVVPSAEKSRLAAKIAQSGSSSRSR